MEATGDSLAGQRERRGPVGWATPRPRQPVAPIGVAGGQAGSHWPARCRSRCLRSGARGTILHWAEGGRGLGPVAPVAAPAAGPGRGCCGRCPRRDGAEAPPPPPGRRSGRCCLRSGRGRGERAGPACAARPPAATGGRRPRCRPPRPRLPAGGRRELPPCPGPREPGEGTARTRLYPRPGEGRLGRGRPGAVCVGGRFRSVPAAPPRVRGGAPGAGGRTCPGRTGVPGVGARE